MGTYRVRAHRSDGWWALEFEDVDGRIHSQVRRLEQAATMAAEAISFWRADEGLPAVTAEQIEVIPVLDDVVAKELRIALELRAAAERVSTEATEAIRTVVSDCLALGLPMRDVGELLHVSHQYVGRLAKEPQHS